MIVLSFFPLRFLGIWLKNPVTPLLRCSNSALCDTHPLPAPPFPLPHPPRGLIPSAKTAAPCVLNGFFFSRFSSRLPLPFLHPGRVPRIRCAFRVSHHLRLPLPRKRTNQSPPTEPPPPNLTTSVCPQHVFCCRRSNRPFVPLPKSAEKDPQQVPPYPALNQPPPWYFSKGFVTPLSFHHMRLPGRFPLLSFSSPPQLLTLLCWSPSPPIISFFLCPSPLVEPSITALAFR